MKTQKHTIEPYRVLFPIGLFAALAGVLLWVFFQSGGLEFYPRSSHANIMFFAFLWSFVAGFLMTAIPKMTGARPASIGEISCASGLALIQLLVNVLTLQMAPLLIILVQTLFLIVFAGRRFTSQRKIPFEGFYFVPFAFSMCALGVLIHLFSGAARADVLYLFAGEAFILNLIMGLGSRLVPVISRIPNALMPHQQTVLSNQTLYLLLAGTLNIGFFIQAFLNPMLGILIRLLVVLFITLKYFKIFSRSSSLGWVPLGLKLGSFLLPVSYLTALITQDAGFATQHLLYIGGFVLITLMIGTRVMLAHGGQDLTYEVLSKRTALVVLLLLAAGALRYLSGADIMSRFMTTAVYAFALAILIWSCKFIHILIRKPESESA